MKLFSEIFQRDNTGSLNVVSELLNIHSIKFTEKKLKDLLTNHIDYPSLVAIKDILEEYGIRSAAIRKESYNYTDFEVPFVSVIQLENSSNLDFILVKDVVEENLIYVDPYSKKTMMISSSNFEKIDKGIILLLDASEKKDEKDLKKNIRNENKEKVLGQFPYFLFFFILCASLVNQLLLKKTSWLSVLFTLTSSFGVIISSLLIWREVGFHSTFLNEVCGSKSKKINCDAILSSNGANFLEISWSIWGASYFYTFFFIQFLYPNSQSNFGIWLIVSIGVSPYILFSLYYQAKIARQWCPLCIGAISVLFINLLSSIFLLISGYKIVFTSWYTFIEVVLIGCLIFYGINFLVSALKRSHANLAYERILKKMKYQPEIFNTLLSKSEKMTISSNKLGIVIGSLNASKEIVKVCNPYCGPCSRAHSILEALVQNNSDVRLRIIFTASGEEGDMRTLPVLHLMELQEKNDPLLLKQALDEWYSSEEKDYEQFANKYPLESDVNNQKEKIIAMRDWCDAMKIRATPTLFINGYELPNSYDISELKYFL